MLRPSRRWNTIALALTTATALLLAGCVGTTPGEEAAPVKLAFSVKDDFDGFVRDTTPLAAALSTSLGRPVEILPVSDESAAIAAVVAGDATAAFLDGGAAWVGWQTFGLEAIAADANGDGRTYYLATAWVRADSDIQTVADLEGRRSCHTGALKSAGMLMPMGYLIRHGHLDVSDLPDDVTSIGLAAERHFDEPIIGGGYEGALQCLSEGRGDVAFIKDTTWQDHCSGDAAPDWCLPAEELRQLVTFAQVPSHPVMVAPGLPADERTALRDALLALNDTPTGQVVLDLVLNTPAIVEVTTEEHLGSYGELISVLPGIKEHIVNKARL